MTTHRFFVDPGTVSGERFQVPGAIAHQVTRVLRLRDGAEIVLLEGDGQEIRCRLDAGWLDVLSRTPALGEPRHRLTVAQALLKGDHLEPVVRHGTEVGVSRFELIVAERSVVRDVSDARLARLRAVAREAAEQSERGIVPEVVAPVPLAEVIGPGSVLLFERTEGSRLSEVPAPERLVIGPEGGFTPDEVAAAERAGATVAGLGPRILRSESVAIAAAAVVLSRTGDFA
ncbi:MAG TPA: RsmE family RNA methyltransferase [Actinomycetota bacterium]|nr:RsmE family RNA methyltransferase [Actinomycetota bacterium]